MTDEKQKVQKALNDRAKFKSDFTDRSYRFGLKTIELVEKLDMKNISCRIIGSQLIRSATSIGANIVEARGSSSKKDYANFFSHALKSANETRYWISLLQGARKIDQNKTDELLQEVTELANILAKSIMTMRGKS